MDQKYQENARAAGLERYAQRSWDLQSAYPNKEAPKQIYEDLLEAYVAAEKLAIPFYTALEEYGKKHKVKVRQRPMQFKDPRRTIEKMKDALKKRLSYSIPTDLLAGTLITDNLERIYAAAEETTNSFEVVSFKDRMIRPKKSGYRDLQLIIRFQDHLIEVKIVHILFQQVDQYEHKIYEIQRSMEAQFQKEFPTAERFVSEALEKASYEMYHEAWQAVLQEEGMQ